MAYQVKISARAERDFARIYAQVNAEFSDTARKWYLGFKRAILSLEEFPNRCPLTPENDKLRHLLYGKNPHVYRAIYRVLESQHVVEVLHVRHGARGDFRARYQ